MLLLLQNFDKMLWIRGFADQIKCVNVTITFPLAVLKLQRKEQTGELIVNSSKTKKVKDVPKIEQHE